MIVKIKIFCTQKSGNAEDEYEDAFYPALDCEMESQTLSAAVADGASEGFLSRQWANLLVNEYCDGDRRAGGLAGFIEAAEASWKEYLAAYIQKRETENRPIQWYEEPGLENGAFSTLIGLSILDGPTPGDKTWEACAVGDTCLFHIRRKELVGCFPIQEAEGFNTWPALISSNPRHNQHVIEKSQFTAGSWTNGDLFFLMSDAIAAWFLHDAEIKHRPWVWMQQFATKTNEEFVEWIHALRENNEIRNDDVTFMSLAVFDS